MPTVRSVFLFRARHIESDTVICFHHVICVHGCSRSPAMANPDMQPYQVGCGPLLPDHPKLLSFSVLKIFIKLKPTINARSHLDRAELDQD